jgi:putative glutamine amidotransferase
MAQTVTERYLQSLIRYAEVDAVLIPAMPGYQAPRAVLRRLDGVFLTGSPSNIEPLRYGQHIADAPGPFDPERDETALDLIGGAVELAKPLFAVCRGFQEINVAFGGSLRRDMSDDGRDLKHHAPSEDDYSAMFDHGHAVTLTPGGTLAKGFGQSIIEVNSAHYQGIDRLGDHLTVEATARDGVIEAIRADNTPAPMLAVQWHPEWAPEIDENSRTYFRLLGAAMRGEAI